LSPKAKAVYVCSECGYESPRWAGRCPSCDEWNTLHEEIRQVVSKSKSASSRVAARTELISITSVDDSDEIRYYTGLSELDRVLGGGLVKGSLVLLGGDPGIGKSTLLLQICQHMGKDHTVLYNSGEESQRQIKLRAARLRVDTQNLFLLSDTNVESVVNTIVAHKPDIVIIDSIQTMLMESLTSAAGSVTQVRECTQALMRCAKNEGIPIWVVGHVNKDGAIAGPKVLEHIVDTVLYFEGERHQNYRILRAVKNRFGSTNEIGVFDMTGEGLLQVDNPSQVMLASRPHNVSGTCVSCVMEGSRPILAEVQALVTKTGFGMARRMSTGFDFNRMAIIIAVLEKRAGFLFSNLDAYVNVVGGLRLIEPGADLAVAMALVSSLKDKAIGDKVLCFGEIGLAGEIRSVNHPQFRVREAVRMGFTRCVLPRASMRQLKAADVGDMELVGVRSIGDAISQIK